MRLHETIFVLRHYCTRPLSRCSCEALVWEAYCSFLWCLRPDDNDKDLYWCGVVHITCRFLIMQQEHALQGRTMMGRWLTGCPSRVCCSWPRHWCQCQVSRDLYTKTGHVLSPFSRVCHKRPDIAAFAAKGLLVTRTGWMDG
jgi:hypothetical protein